MVFIDPCSGLPLACDTIGLRKKSSPELVALAGPPDCNGDDFHPQENLTIEIELVGGCCMYPWYNAGGNVTKGDLYFNPDGTYFIEGSGTLVATDTTTCGGTIPAFGYIYNLSKGTEGKTVEVDSCDLVQLTFTADGPCCLACLVSTQWDLAEHCGGGRTPACPTTLTYRNPTTNRLQRVNKRDLVNRLRKTMRYVKS